MHRGYVKLWRKSVDSAAWMDEGLWKVWCWCLFKANWEAKEVPIKVGRKIFQVPVQAGQFVYGRHAASLELNMPESTVRNRMARLATLGNVDTESDSNYSIVTISNWSVYDDPENAKGQLVGQEEDKKRTQRRKKKKVKEEGVHSQNGQNSKQIPPSIFAVAAYCTDRKNGIDAEHFVNYYQARGWVLSNNAKMKDWHCAIQTWEKRDKQPLFNPPESKPIVKSQLMLKFDAEQAAKAAAEAAAKEPQDDPPPF